MITLPTFARPASRPRRTAALPGAAVLAILLSFVPALAAPTPAGTLIVNQARAVIDGEEVVPSNRVQTVVKAVCAPRLGPAGTADAPGQRFATVAPATVYVPYRLANHGNFDTGFPLGVEVDADGAWTPDAATHYLDANDNGLVDPNEGVVERVELEAGARQALILAVAPPAGARGDLVVAPTAACGDVSANDASVLVSARAASAPALRIQQGTEIVAEEGSLRGAALRSAARVTRYRATVAVANYGGGTAVSPRLTVDLAPFTTKGFRPDLDAVRAPKGTIEVEGVGGWRSPAAADADDARRLRLSLPALAPDEEAVLVFELESTTGGSSAEIPLVSEAESDGDEARTRAVSYLDVEAAHEHRLDLAPDALFLIQGQTRCFPVELANLGTDADRYALSADPLLADASGVSVTLESTTRTLFGDAASLDAGAATRLLACVRSDVVRDDPFEIVVRAVSDADGRERAARGTVRAVEPADRLVLRQSADPAATVEVGEEVLYTLTLRNGFAFPLTDVRVRADLASALDFVRAGEAGVLSPASRIVRWELGRLEAGAEARVTLVLRVAEAAEDDAPLRNRFDVRAAELTNPVASNVVTHAARSSLLLLEADVDPKRNVTYGDVLTHTLKASNDTRGPLDLAIHVRLADGVRLLGSELVDEDGGTTELAPGREGRTLTWDGLDLADGESVTIRYRVRVLPSAPLRLASLALAEGRGANGLRLESDPAPVDVDVEPGVFDRDEGVLLGRVFLDGDDDGRWTEGVDAALEDVRLILPDGVQTFTDGAGRYAFRGVEVGATSLLVDPDSLGFAPRFGEGALDTHRVHVHVQGVSVQDVPVVAPRGVAAAERSTELRFGPLTVRKELRPDADGTEVRLTLSSAEPLPDLRVEDPRPDGGTETFAFDVFEGTRTLTYSLEGDAVLTDPQARWRYP